MMKKGKKNSNYYNKLQSYGYIFILPSVIMFSIFSVYPMLNSLYLSLFEWNLVSKKIFIGFKNFINLFSNAEFLNSYKITFHFTFFSMLIIMILAFFLALAFTTKIRFKNILQSTIFLPVIFTTVAVGVIWNFMFQNTGLLSYIFALIFKLNIPWLTSTKVAPYAMILVHVWKMTGFYMVLFLAGLLDIPETYYEAAKLDGASFWQTLIYITIPQLKNTIVLVSVSIIIFSFGTFDLQYVMTAGSPAGSTKVLGLLIYKEAFEFNKFGYASAISVVFFITLLFFSIIQFGLYNKSESEAE